MLNVLNVFLFCITLRRISVTGNKIKFSSVRIRINTKCVSLEGHLSQKILARFPLKYFGISEH